MKKTIVFAGMLTSIVATAQDYDQRVGINTQTPRASLEVKATDFDSRTQGILFPYINETEKAKWATDNDKGLVAGTVIWNTTKKCLDYFDGTTWQCTDGTKKNTHPTSWFDVATLEISPLTFSGEYKDGKVFTNANTVKFRLKNTGTEAISNLNLTNAVTIANGSATITAIGQNANAVNIPVGGYIDITYILSGKPEEGLLTATLSYESKTASNSTTVAEKTATLPDKITINEGKLTIFSMYDNNYFPYTAPATDAVASWEINVNPDTTNETLIDIQGTIPATGRTVKIPITYTGTTATTLEAYTSKAVAIDPKGEQGVSNSTRKLILSWNEQNITSSTKFITAKITPADGQILNVTKLDLNAGLGGDLIGPILTIFYLPESNLNTTTKVPYTVRVTPAIPDKNYFTDNNHKFFYLPIRAEDGKIWLNNNLGAEYAKYGGKYFDPSQQSTVYHDWRGAGSLFQWGRLADGHELITRTDTDTSGAQGVGPTTTTRAKSWEPGHSDFIVGIRKWVDENTAGLRKTTWVDEICPDGFRIPSGADFLNLADLSMNTGIYKYPLKEGGNLIKLNLFARFRDNNGVIATNVEAGSYRYIISDNWGRAAIDVNQIILEIPANGNVDSTKNSIGMPIRCIGK